jgi:hypothetical protein
MNDDTTALETQAVEPGNDAGQSQAPEVQAQTVSTPEAKSPEFDIEAFKKSVLDEARKTAKEQAEQERRRVQSEADRKIQQILNQTKAEVDAARQAMVDALKETGIDDDTLNKVQSTLPLRQKAAQYDAMLAEQQSRTQAQMLEAQALAAIQKIGLKREDFGDGEWGGGMPLDVWYEQVAVPKALKLANERALKQAVDAKVAEIKTEKTEVQAKAQTGATVMDTGAGGVPDRKTQLTKKFRGSGKVGEYLRQLERE